MSKAAVAETHEEATGIEKIVSGPERIVQFLKDTRAEMHKVVTPTRAEVQATTIVVVVTVFLFAAYFELVDVVLGKGIDQMFVHLLKK
jgi:preprotein translocase subunit SecE